MVQQASTVTWYWLVGWRYLHCEGAWGRGNMKNAIRESIIATAAVLPTFLSGCVTTPPKVEAYVALPVGSTFTHAEHFTGSYVAENGVSDQQVTDTRGERMWEGRQVITFSSVHGTIVAEPPPSGSWIAILGPGDKPFIRWDPPIGFEWPMEVGKEWKESHQVILGTGQTIPFDVSCKVQSYEDVTVPNGTYKVFKTACNTSTGVEQISWWAPDLGIFVKYKETRSPAYRGGPGTQEWELVSLNIKK